MGEIHTITIPRIMATRASEERVRVSSLSLLLLLLLSEKEDAVVEVLETGIGMEEAS
jgi:hypothetical protein